MAGFLSLLPGPWAPFAELARIDKPAGIYLFYFPHLFGTLYSACLSAKQMQALPSIFDLLRLNAVLLTGTALFRASACSWNDTMDIEYDRKVARCRNRPLARGALSPWQAHVVTITTALMAATCLGILPPSCWIVAMPSIFLLWLYPFAKRFTDFPQVILGVQVAMGFFMGITAQDESILSTLLVQWNAHGLVTSIAAFYGAQICWTVIYDTVYAQQDVEDDAKAGVRSMAVRFRGRAKILLWTVSIIKVLLLAISGYAADFGEAYMAAACGGVAISLAYMITTINLSKPAECAWWFKKGCWFIAISVFTGLVLEMCAL